MSQALGRLARDYTTHNLAFKTHAGAIIAGLQLENHMSILAMTSRLLYVTELRLCDHLGYRFPISNPGTAYVSLNLELS